MAQRQYKTEKMDKNNALLNYCIRLGDDALIHAARLSEWCSNAPMLEEDLALTNFSLDLIGRAQALLTYAGNVEGKGRTEDDFAYRRPERSFQNLLITELPNGDFAHTIARLLFISVFEKYFFEELAKSADETIAAIAAKTLKEVRYHSVHATEWTIRLGAGTEESHARMQAAIDALWMYTGELFESDEVDAVLQDLNIAADRPVIKNQWTAYIKGALATATLKLPEDSYMQTGGRKGIHTEYLGHILSEMQYLQRAYPDAKW
jgi:ring-1,2-phenylacetyl-CoA epoxidase subunit PaaC